MKRLFMLIGIIVCTLCVQKAEARMTATEIEDYVINKVTLKNYDGIVAALIENKYEIKGCLDGKFNCKDRAEIAVMIAQKEGYKTEYHTEDTGVATIKHRYVTLIDENGNSYDIFKKDTMRINVRREIARMK